MLCIMMPRMGLVRSSELVFHHPSTVVCVCDLLNKLSFSIFNSFNDLLGYTFARGVPSYIPKRGSFEDAICIDHFIGSSNVVCKTGSIVQCSELGHVQAADDHIPIAVFFQFPVVNVTAPIPRKKVRYDRAS